jgi:hypothetical protein
MNKRIVVVLVLVFVATLLLGSAWQVNAKANHIEGLKAYEYDCAILHTFQPVFSGKEGEEHIMHIRDYVHVNIIQSESPYLAGKNTTFANAEMNFKNGSITIRGTSRIEPTAYPGSTWEGNWIFIGSKGASFGWSVAHGTGELAGMTLFMNLYDAELADDAAEMCATVSYEGEAGVPEETFSDLEGYIVVSNRK